MGPAGEAARAGKAVRNTTAARQTTAARLFGFNPGWAAWVRA